MQIIREALISELMLNDCEPRQWEWRYPELNDLDTYKEDRFICTADRYPWTRIMYSEQIRRQYFERAVKRVEDDDMDEVRQFRPIIIDDEGFVISGMKILQIYKCAGKKSVEVAQIFGLTLSEKLEMMMADSENFEQHNWTPNLPRFKHEKVPHFRDN
jgi:hypothetical protein